MAATVAATTLAAVLAALIARRSAAGMRPACARSARQPD
jgi:hypothetical protein